MPPTCQMRLFSAEPSGLAVQKSRAWWGGQGGHCWAPQPDACGCSVPQGHWFQSSSVLMGRRVAVMSVAGLSLARGSHVPICPTDPVPGFLTLLGAVASVTVGHPPPCSLVEGCQW